MIIDLTWSDVSGDLLKTLHGQENLRGLILCGNGVSDTELRHLGELPNLEYINLTAGNVTVEGLLRLGSSRKLKAMQLADVRPRIDDNALEQIVSAWPHLESLCVRSSEITDAGLSHIGKLRHLRHLNVDRTRITGKGLESLTELSELRTLHACETDITDQGMLHLGRIASLEKINVNHTGITDQGLKEIQSLPRLRRIYFVGTEVTDEGLEYLKPLKTINYVGFSGHVSDKAKDELKESLPLFKKNKAG
jgi:hypothetical protein